MVQVAPNLTIVDLTIRGLSPGKYWATVRQTGDISNGAISTCDLWTDPDDGPIKRGVFGAIEVGQDGMGSIFLDKPIQVWEMIGRGMADGAANISQYRVFMRV